MDLWGNTYFRNIMSILMFIYLLENISFWLTFLMVGGVIYIYRNSSEEFNMIAKKIIGEVVK